MSRILLKLKIERRYGLSNRIRAMAGYYALSRIKNWDICYEWLEDESCPGMFDELFKFSLIPQAAAVSTSSYEKVVEIYAGSKPTHCGSSEATIFKAYFPAIDKKDDYDLEIRKFYESLIPVDEVGIKLEKLWIECGAEPANTLGLHIRRTDMVEHLKNIGEPPLSDEKTIASVRQYLASNKDVSRIFLSCDNAESEKLFKSEFEEKVFCYNKGWKEDKLVNANSVKFQSRLTSLQDALVDVLMLSKCRFIIGTRHSSFSTFAAKIGNTKYTRV
jgi:hypothetical protein